jgi:hypothetical protein
MTRPVIIAAVGRLAPRAPALAGMIGRRLPSAIPKRSDGAKTGKFKLDILKVWAFVGT